MKKTYTTQLHLVLKAMYNRRTDEYETAEQLKGILNGQLTLTEIQVCLHFLGSNGYVLSDWKDGKDCGCDFKTIEVYKISLNGVSFIESGSFRMKKITDIVKIAWTVVKTISVAVSSVVIIWIGFLQYKAAKEANEDRKKVIYLQGVVDSLENNNK